MEVEVQLIVVIQVTRDVKFMNIGVKMEKFLHKDIIVQTDVKMGHVLKKNQLAQIPTAVRITMRMER